MPTELHPSTSNSSNSYLSYFSTAIAPADSAIARILRYHDAVRSYERSKGTGRWTNQKWDLLSPAALYRLALTCVTKDGPQSPADWERAQSLPETGHPTMSVRRESWRNRA